MARTRIVLEPEEMRELNKRVRASTVPARDRQRAQIILLAADGGTQEAIGKDVGVTRVTVNHWRPWPPSQNQSAKPKTTSRNRT